MSAIEAKHAGRCGACQQPIEEGDRIVCVDDEWVHEDCEEEAMG